MAGPNKPYKHYDEELLRSAFRYQTVSTPAMNFSFESSKRKVSLGGRSRIAESREEVLKRTHLERQKRAQERLEHKSALQIQARLT